MEQYVKGFKGFTPVKMCGLSPLASFYSETLIRKLYFKVHGKYMDNHKESTFGF